MLHTNEIKANKSDENNDDDELLCQDEVKNKILK